jgi:hypothetical protein
MVVGMEMVVTEVRVKIELRLYQGICLAGAVH